MDDHLVTMKEVLHRHHLLGIRLVELMLHTRGVHNLQALEVFP